jgi:hypothetical protein
MRFAYCPFVLQLVCCGCAPHPPPTAVRLSPHAPTMIIADLIVTRRIQIDLNCRGLPSVSSVPSEAFLGRVEMPMAMSGLIPDAIVGLQLFFVVVVVRNVLIAVFGDLYADIMATRAEDVRQSCQL